VLGLAKLRGDERLVLPLLILLLLMLLLLQVGVLEEGLIFRGQRLKRRSSGRSRGEGRKRSKLLGLLLVLVLGVDRRAEHSLNRLAGV
jgi:hypothetical protein